MNVEEFYGRKIQDVIFTEESMTLKFEDGRGIQIIDAGQDCCEHRYMTTDDNVADLIGGMLRKIEEKPGPEVEEEYDVHETCFVEVATQDDHIIITNHNEHNGYYGGFLMRVFVVGTDEEVDIEVVE